jgi:hypothetical protein
VKAQWRGIDLSCTRTGKLTSDTPTTVANMSAARISPARPNRVGRLTYGFIDLSSDSFNVGPLCGQKGFNPITVDSETAAFAIFGNRLTTDASYSEAMK